MELIQRSLCQSDEDYDKLLVNIDLVRSTLKTDLECNILFGPATIILENMFRTATSSPVVQWGFWRDARDNRPPADVVDPLTTANQSCFTDLIIYYYDKKDCIIEEPYFIMGGECLNTAYSLAKTGTTSPQVDIPPETPFSLLADIFAHYLGDVVGKSFDDVSKVMDALCKIITDKIEINRTFNKTLFTINKNEL